MPARPRSLSLSGEDIRALGALAADAGGGIARLSGDVHTAVADRVFLLLSTARLPVAGVQRSHDLIARGAHAGARALTGAVVQGLGGALASTRPAAARPLGASPRGAVAQGALAGAWGDRLQARDSVLAPRFALIVDDRRPVTSRLAVFVHGLGESDRAWRRPGYGELLAERYDVTPVYARYNSGTGIEASADALASGLTALVDGWPVPVAEIMLVGHSMGGLVIRAACHGERATPWIDRVRVTVGLGSPHEGAPLARVAEAAERALGVLPETRPFAAPLRARSAGVRDLERGLQSPFAPGAEHYFVSASVTRDPHTPAARVLGDLLVSRRSAWAQSAATERLRFAEDHYRHLGGATHFDLLGNPAIAELLCDWIDRPRMPLAPGRGVDAGPRAPRPHP